MAKKSASSNGFEKDPKRASLAGKKSSRALPPEIKELRQAHAREFEAVIYRNMGLTKQEILAKLNDPLTPALDLVFLSVLQKAIVQGDHQRLNFLMERTVGKVIEKVETVDKTSEHELEALAEKLLEIAKKPE